MDYKKMRKSPNVRDYSKAQTAIRVIANENPYAKEARQSKDQWDTAVTQDMRHKIQRNRSK